jgi:hypothetical protein
MSNLYPVRVPRPQPTNWSDVWGAAFNLENDVTNMIDLAQAQSYPLDPEYRFQEHMAAHPDQDFVQRNSRDLLRAQSADEFSWLEQRIRQEERERAIIADAGWGGIGAALVAGILSPTMFIPLVGQARGARGVAQAFALGATAGTAAELPLYMNQQTRTLGETAFGIAAGTVLGGLLGSTAVYFRSRSFDRIARDLDPEVTPALRAAIVRQADGSMRRIGETDEMQNLPLTGPAARPVDPAPVRVEQMPAAEPQAGVRYVTMSPEAARLVRADGLTLGPGVELTDVPSMPQRQTAAAANIGDGPEPQVPVAPAESPAVALLRVEGPVPEAGAPPVPASRISHFDPESGGWKPLARQAEEMPVERAEGASVGAARTGERYGAVREVVDPATGKVSYEQVITEAEATQMDPALLVGETVSRVSPVTRAVRQTDQPVRSGFIAGLMLRLSDSGVSFRGSDRGLAPAAEGVVEHRLNFYRALQGKAYRKMYEEYLDYLTDAKPQNFLQRRLNAVRTEFNFAPNGKMTYSEWQELLAEALNKSDVSDLPSIARTASYFRKEILEEVNKAQREAAELWGRQTLYREFDEAEDGESYFRHQFSPRQVAADQQGFIRMVADHVAGRQRAAWERRMAKVREKEAKDLEYLELLSMDADEARLLIDRNNAALAEMKAAPDARVDRIQEMRQRAAALEDERLEELMAQPRNPLMKSEPTEAELRAQARAETRDLRREMRLQADALEQGLPDEVRKTLEGASALRRQNRALARSFGRLQEKQSEALAKIEANEAANIAAFQRVVTATQRLMRDMDNLADDVLDAELAKLQKAFQRAHKAAARGEAQLDRLEEDLLFTGYSGRGPLEASMKQTGRRLAEGRAFDRLTKAELRDRDLARQAAADRLDEAIAYVNGVNSKRAERNALIKQRMQKLDPANVEAEQARIRGRIDSRYDELDARMEKAGAHQFNARTGLVNFQEAAEKYATEMATQIMGNSPRVAQIDAMVGVRSPMRMRTLDIDYDVKSKYLEKNVESILDRYLRTMGSDIELFRATGDRSGSKMVQDVADEMQRIRQHIETRSVDETGKEITPALRAKQLEQHDKATKSRLQEFQGTIDRIRGLRGIPDNPAGIGHRLARFFLNYNVTTMMGVAAVTSIPDAGRPVMIHGLGRTFRDGWVPLVQSMIDEGTRKQTKQTIRELRLAGIGIDVFTQQRAKNIMDTLEPSLYGGKLERGMEYLAHKMPVLALFGPWTDMMKTVAGTVAMARISRSVIDAAAGRASAADIKYLAQAGIDETMVRRIAAQLESPNGGTRYKDVIIPNSESWDDYAALRVWQSALSREDARTVISPGLERPLVSDGSMPGRLLFQFRSFTMAANSKMLIAGLQSRDMAAIHATQGLVFSLALGTLSYYIWAMTAGERQRQEMLNASWEEWMDQAIYRSGVLGALSEIQQVGSEIPATRRFTTFADSTVAGRRANSIVGAVAGPTFGAANNIAAVLANMDDPTEGTVRQARKLLPYQNIFLWRRGLDAVEASVSSAFGLPESRR